jgi:hypothetical protein
MSPPLSGNLARAIKLSLSGYKKQIRERHHTEFFKKVWEGLALSEGMGCTLKTSPDLPDIYYIFKDIYTFSQFNSADIR